MTGEGWKFANKRDLITLRNVIVRMARNLVKGCSDHRLLHGEVEGVGTKVKFCSKKHITCILILPNSSQKKGMLDSQSVKSAIQNCKLSAAIRYGCETWSLMNFILNHDVTVGVREQSDEEDIRD